jgi:hypothetical protein
LFDVGDSRAVVADVDDQVKVSIGLVTDAGTVTFVDQPRALAKEAPVLVEDVRDHGDGVFALRDGKGALRRGLQEVLRRVLWRLVVVHVRVYRGGDVRDVVVPGY